MQKKKKKKKRKKKRTNFLSTTYMCIQAAKLYEHEEKYIPYTCTFLYLVL